MVGTSYVSYYSVHANTLVIGPLFTTLERWKIQRAEEYVSVRGSRGWL